MLHSIQVFTLTSRALAEEVVRRPHRMPRILSTTIRKVFQSFFQPSPRREPVVLASAH